MEMTKPKCLAVSLRVALFVVVGPDCFVAPGLLREPLLATAKSNVGLCARRCQLVVLLVRRFRRREVAGVNTWALSHWCSMLSVRFLAALSHSYGRGRRIVVKVAS